MTSELASANVNRSYQLAASSIAIFTFQMLFLYPQHIRGEIDALPFQLTLIVMSVATFSFAFASFYYYSASLPDRIDAAAIKQNCRKGDRCWLLGCLHLFLAPSLILFTVGVLVAACAWFALWLVYLGFAFRNFSRIQAGP